MKTEEYIICYIVYFPIIKSFIRKNINCKEKAKDITQDAFSILFVKKDNVNYVKVGSYLFTTAKNIMINSIKRENKYVDFEQVDTSNYIYTPQYPAPYLKKILNNALSKLPEIQRKVFLLRHYDGYSYKEIKEKTGLSKSQVEVYIHRAKACLQKYLGNI